MKTILGNDSENLWPEQIKLRRKNSKSISHSDRMKRLLWKPTHFPHPPFHSLSRSHAHPEGGTPWFHPGFCWRLSWLTPSCWHCCLPDGDSHATDFPLNYTWTWTWIKNSIFPLLHLDKRCASILQRYLLLWFGSIGGSHQKWYHFSNNSIRYDWHIKSCIYLIQTSQG